MSTISTNALAGPSPAALAGGAGSSALGRDEFLQLLVAQLRNQDPTSPQNGHEFAAQLAQFSQVEQLTNISASMAGQARQVAALAGAIDGLRAGQAGMTSQLTGRIDLQSATALIGQTVEMAGATVAWAGTGEAPIPVRLDGAAREVEVTIRDADGALVRTMRTGALSEGDHELSWDGALDDGSAAPEGAYTVSVSALGPEGEPVRATAVTRGTVDRLTVERDGLFLWVGGRPIPFQSLLSVVPGGA
ncbi:flagellar hook assembly protein FlgD [Rubrivirga sp.]|uniref:flagellar hook assembly protein FlgD n=1 Tax=Rubrivirga sp. TaxID=1885344 RepID=UPI003B51C083